MPPSPQPAKLGWGVRSRHDWSTYYCRPSTGLLLISTLLSSFFGDRTISKSTASISTRKSFADRPLTAQIDTLTLRRFMSLAPLTHVTGAGTLIVGLPSALWFIDVGSLPAWVRACRRQSGGRGVPSVGRQVICQHSITADKPELLRRISNAASITLHSL